MNITQEVKVMEKTLLEKYTTTFGCRFTRSQKKKFLSALHEDMSALGYSSEMILGKKLVSRSNSYLFGNLKQAKTLIVVPYDTPEKKFWNKVLYFPMDGTKTASKTMMATYVPLLIVFAFVFVGVYLVQPRLTSNIANFSLSLVMFILTFTLVYMMLHGFRNKNNFNRNSASISAVVEIARKLDKDERRKVAFLFTDKNKLHFLGADSSMKYFTENGKNPNLICFDCIANGSQTRIGYNPQNRKLAADIVKHFPQKKHTVETVKLSEDMRMQSAMSFFKKAVLISSGEVDKDGNLYVLGTGTGKDTVIDEKKLDEITEMMVRYLHNEK